MKIKLFLIITFVITSCKSGPDEKSENNHSTIEKYDFDSFLFFKKGMNISSVEQTLVEKGIFFNEIDSIPSYLFTNFELCNLTYRKDKLRIIKCNSLKIINQVMPEFYLGFINDTLVIMEYNTNIFSVDDVKSNELRFSAYIFIDEKDVYKYNSVLGLDKMMLKIKEENELFKEVYYALYEKYGKPSDASAYVPFNIFEIAEDESYIYEELERNKMHTYSGWYSNKGVKIEISRNLECSIINNSEFDLNGRNKQIYPEYNSSIKITFDSISINKAKKEKEIYDNNISNSIKKNKNTKRKKELEKI